MTRTEDIKINIRNLEDSKLAERLRTSQFSEEAKPIAEEELLKRGYELPKSSFTQIKDILSSSPNTKPYEPRLLPVLFLIFAVQAGGKLGAYIFGAIGAGIGAGVFGIVSWYLASNIAKFTRRYNKLVRFPLQLVALIIWAALCIVIGGTVGWL